MAQETLVLKITPAEASALQERLQQALPQECDWRSVPHAHFSGSSVSIEPFFITSGPLFFTKLISSYQASGKHWLAKPSRQGNQPRRCLQNLPPIAQIQNPGGLPEQQTS